MNTLPERGKLEDYCTAQIFLAHHRAKSTGRLMFISEGARKIVFLDEGRPVWAVSNEVRDRLGHIFLDQGLITHVQLDFAISRCPVGMKLGAVLVKLKFITPEELIRGVKLRMKRIMLSTFTLGAGFFFFREEALDDDEIVRIRIEPNALIREGIQCVADPDILMNVLGSMEHRPCPTALASCVHLASGLVDNDRYVLELAADGGKDIRTICTLSRLPAIETCRSLFYLSLKGLIRVAEPKVEQHPVSA